MEQAFMEVLAWIASIMRFEAGIRAQLLLPAEDARRQLDLLYPGS